MTQPFVERYDPFSETFVPLPDMKVLIMPDLLTSQTLQPEIPDDSKVFVVATIYDVAETTIRALRNAARRWQKSYASVFNSPRAIKEIVEAQTGAIPIMNVSFPPREIKDRLAWQQAMLERAFTAGCLGGLVDFVPVEIAQEYPDRLLFRSTEARSRS